MQRATVARSTEEREFLLLYLRDYAGPDGSVADRLRRARARVVRRRAGHARCVRRRAAAPRSGVRAGGACAARGRRRARDHRPDAQQDEYLATARGLVRRAGGIERAGGVRPAHGLRRRPPCRHRGSRASDAAVRCPDLHLLQGHQGADAGRRPRAVRARPPVRAHRCARTQARPAQRADDPLVVCAQRRLTWSAAGTAATVRTSARRRSCAAYPCRTNTM